MIETLRLRKGKPPHPKRFDLDADPLKLKAVSTAKGVIGWSMPVPFNLEGTPVGSGMFAVYAVRGVLYGTLKVKGDIKAVTPVTPVAFDLEGAGAEVWSYDLEGVAA